jgi:hypothetical protein
MLHKKGIYPIEYTFNGTANHWRDIVGMQKYVPLQAEIVDVFAKQFHTLHLTKQKAFVWANITPSSHILFKNTIFPQHVVCDDEVYIWNYDEIRSLSRFYKDFYGRN